MADVTLSGVKKSYGRVQVVHGVDIDIADGEFLVMVGPSGCGKSTILRMIAGLESITEGQITIGGATVNRLEPKDRNIAMVFQNYALYPHLSVYENMAYGLKVRGRAAAEIRQRVEEAAAVLGLGDYLERKPRQLSGGQRQRVAMGRAIVRNPSVFLLDEPLSNLDAKLRNQMRVELKRLHQRLGNTFIYVTHDQVEAMTLADRIMVMNAGHVEQVGTPEEIYHSPATMFVANFMGSPAMNMLPGEALPETGCVRLREGHEIPVNGQLPQGWTGRVVLGIRPEDVALADEGTRPDCTLEAVVELVEPLGPDTVVHSRPVGCEGELIVRLPAASRVREGDRLRLAVDPLKLHLFSEEDGRRISAAC